MPRSLPEPPRPPLTCGACIRSDHDGCLVTAFGEDGQMEPCSCPCGGGGDAWRVE